MLQDLIISQCRTYVLTDRSSVELLDTQLMRLNCPFQRGRKPSREASVTLITEAFAMPLRFFWGVPVVIVNYQPNESFEFFLAWSH